MGLFDFLYLPYDLTKHLHKGYGALACKDDASSCEGFVNFIHPVYALQFRDAMSGQFLSRQPGEV